MESFQQYVTKALPDNPDPQNERVKEMMKYYWLYPSDVEEDGVAYAPEAVTFKLLYERGHISDWSPITFELRDGALSDFQANDLGWDMCSPRLRSCFEQAPANNQALEWLPVSVTAGAVSHEYFVLHPAVRHDVLDKQRSIFSGDHLVKPVLNTKLIGEMNVFSAPGTQRIYVSEVVERLCAKAGVTGVKFVRAPAT